MKIDTDAVTISPQSPVNPAGSNARPSRGFEDSGPLFANPTEASRKGNGPRPFMGHSGPVAGDPGIDRGQFSSRSVKQGPC
jgi:hypothetical protein